MRRLEPRSAGDTRHRPLALKETLTMPEFRRVRTFAIAALLAAALHWPISVHAQGAAPSAPPPALLNAAPSPPAGAASVATAPDQVLDGKFGFFTDDFSPWGMFLHADIVVKIVILGLIFASLVTWTIWLAKTIELAMAKRRLTGVNLILRNARTLTLAAETIGTSSGVARALVREAGDEWRRSVEALDDHDGLKERIALHLERVEALAGRRMMIGTGVLATIGSTAPFVGLFGTVWGIMNSFIGIAKMHTTNLVVVAPGIAEALMATAFGLIAAIPAVVIYNHFVREIASCKALVANAASSVMALVSRDLSLGDHAIADAVKAETGRQPADKPMTKSALRLMTE
jgi:biopolymer transport protein ExbB